MFVPLWALAACAGIVAVVLVAALTGRRPVSHAAAVASDADRAVFLKASEALLAGDRPQALRILATALGTDNDADVHMLMIRILADMGEHGRAVELLENLLLRPRLDPEIRNHARVTLAGICMQTGAWSRAEQVLTEVAQSVPSREAPFRQLARVYVQTGDFKNARKMLSRWEKLAGASAGEFRGEMVWRQGAVLLGENRPGEAKKLYSRAVKQMPESPFVMLLGARLALEKADEDEAARLCRLAVSSPLAQQDLALELRVMILNGSPAVKHACARAVIEGIDRRTPASQRSGIWLAVQAAMLTATGADAAAYAGFARGLLEAHGWDREPAAGTTVNNQPTEHDTNA